MSLQTRQFAIPKTSVFGSLISAYERPNTASILESPTTSVVGSLVSTYERPNTSSRFCKDPQSAVGSSISPTSLASLVQLSNNTTELLITQKSGNVSELPVGQN